MLLAGSVGVSERPATPSLSQSQLHSCRSFPPSLSTHSFHPPLNHMPHPCLGSPVVLTLHPTNLLEFATPPANPLPAWLLTVPALWTANPLQCTFIMR